MPLLLSYMLSSHNFLKCKIQVCFNISYCNSKSYSQGSELASSIKATQSGGQTKCAIVYELRDSVCVDGGNSLKIVLKCKTKITTVLSFEINDFSNFEYVFYEYLRLYLIYSKNDFKR